MLRVMIRFGLRLGAAPLAHDVAVTADVTDMAAAQASMASPSPEMAAAMDKHGVIQPITAHIEK